MAFKDISLVLYDGKVKVDYLDKSHRYYTRMRQNWDLPVEDKDAWDKPTRPKGTTTIIGDTLEKKGLQQWPKNVALRELFGYYGKFTGDNGKEISPGFSKGVGTMWEIMGQIDPCEKQEEILALVESAAAGWQRKQQKGADIGSVVHDAIEHYILKEPYDIAENYMWNIKEAWPLPKDGEPDLHSDARDKALEDFTEDVEKATKAFNNATAWWDSTVAEVYGAEQIVYSLKHHICGTYDFHIEVKRSDHPVFKRAVVPTGLMPVNNRGKPKEEVRITGDWKTSNAYRDAPEGVSYDYFIQSAIYEMIRREMGMEPADDLVVVSCRKDGGFAVVYASELGLSVNECIGWAEAVISCHQMMNKTKKALLAHAEAAKGEDSATTKD